MKPSPGLVPVSRRTVLEVLDAASLEFAEAGDWY